jgi:hypothetical protein
MNGMGQVFASLNSFILLGVGLHKENAKIRRENLGSLLRIQAEWVMWVMEYT